MSGDLGQYLIIGLTAFLTTYFLTPLVRLLAMRLGAVDLPGERRPHQKPTARGGGLAVFIGVHVSCLVVTVLPGFNIPGSADLQWWVYFALASLILLVIGIIDDVRGLGPAVKLAGQTAAALFIALSGTHFGNFLGHKLPFALDCLLVVIWIVAVINAFNLIDGLDGLASGLAVISAVGLCGVFFFEKMPGNVLVLVALIAACFGFLRYNLHPATIFLGDTGSMFLGFALSVVSLQTFTKGPFVLSMTIPLLVLGIPIYDALLAVWRRSVRKWLQRHQATGAAKRFGLMQADVEHLHHRLLRMGLSTRRVAAVLCILNSGLVMFGLLLALFQSRAAGIFLIALLAAVYVLMRHLAAIELQETGRALLMGLQRPTHSSLKSIAYEVWDMIWLAGAVAFAMRVLEGGKPQFWHSWFLDLPVWVSPTFSLLALSRTYLTVWTRARTRDVILLFLLLESGLVLSLGVALLIDPANARQLCVRALFVAAVSHPAILGIRLVYRCIEELVTHLRSSSQASTGVERIILYGAGGRCQLFLKERGFNNSSSFDGRVIVGLLDDDPALHGQWVQGCPVLGPMKDLPLLVQRHRITGVIITAALSPEVHAATLGMAGQLGLSVTEWCFHENQILAATIKTLIPPAPAPQLTASSPLPTHQAPALPVDIQSSYLEQI
jgi:UDP-N-acetylmuramyl pentapeptide phosphotransferase/UDP-N-acetylglucosamine-1-phosphate transferase